MFDYIEDYYKMGLYSVDDLKTLLMGNLLTQEEYESLIAPVPEA